MEPSFFVTNTIEDAQRLFDGEMVPLSSMSCNKVCTVFWHGNETLFACYWIGAAPSVSM